MQQNSDASTKYMEGFLSSLLHHDSFSSDPFTRQSCHSLRVVTVYEEVRIYRRQMLPLEQILGLHERGVPRQLTLHR